MLIRVFSDTDLADLLAIEQLTQPFPWSEDIFVRCWKVGYLGWVAEIEGKVVAFVLMSIQVGEGHILNLCVHPDYQRRGIGGQLVDHALNIAKEKGAGMGFLEVRRSNISAIALYHKLGFVQISDRKNYYPAQDGREDALVFAKDLLVQ